jgi:hypothetical protein
MSENGNGRNGGSGVFGTIATVAKRLSAEFIAITLINLVFVGSMIWLSDRQNSSRERVLQPILTACANSVPIEVFKYMAPLGHPAP